MLVVSLWLEGEAVMSLVSDGGVGSVEDMFAGCEGGLVGREVGVSREEKTRDVDICLAFSSFEAFWNLSCRSREWMGMSPSWP